MPNFTVTTELFYDGVWNDISTDVRVPAGVDIQWGRSDGAGGPEPSRLGLIINNANGKYSPRNPASPLFTKIGRNTQIRVTISGDTAFSGEVSSWPPRWNIPGTNTFMPIEAAGILRRINQGDELAGSSTRGYYASTDCVTYYPLDEGTGSTAGLPAAGTYQLSKFQTIAAAKVTYGVGPLAGWMPAGLRIDDTVNVFGIAGNSGELYSPMVGSQATPNALAWEFTFRADPTAEGALSNGLNPGTLLCEGQVTGNTGSQDLWRLQTRRSTDNDLQLTVVLDAAGTPTTVALADTAPLAEITDGQMHHVRVQLAQNGANTDYAVYLDGVSVISGTRTTHTVKRFLGIRFVYDRDGSLLQDMMDLGHVIAWETTTNIPTIVATFAAVNGFAGEPAGRRIERLCGEQGIPVVAGGDLDDTLLMGRQFEDKLSGQFAECEATDGGLIGESRSAVELYYTPRTALYNQAPLAVIDYDAGELSPPLEPVDDDQFTRNDVFAQRREGGSYRLTQETGPLSVQAPPNGVGRYKSEVQVNVQTDDDLPPVAGWLLGVGTLDAARFPQVTINRNNPAVAASVNNLGITVRLVDAGEMIRITGGPKLVTAAGVYDDIDLLVLGGRRYCDGFNDVFTFNCVPYQPYRVAAVETQDGRVDPDGALTLTSGINTTANSFQITCAAGTLASTDSADYPCSIMIGGEEMTIGTVTGASSPQTASSVTRSVNGVVKAHSAGAVLALKTPGLVAL